jgi:hypothetical protein
VLPPSPLAASAEPESDARPAWWRTAVAALVLPVVGFLLTWGSELVEGLLQPLVGRPVHLPPVGIVPMLGPGYLTAVLTVTVAFGFVPGALIALVDRRTPYVSAAVAPAAFGLFQGEMCLVTIAAGNLPRTPLAVWLLLIVMLPLAAWSSAAAGIALVRSRLR